MTLLVIDRIDVSERALEALVRVDPERIRTSDVPQLPERILSALPGLARHRCENDTGARFVDEARDTELAHLLEHVTFELMAQSGSPRTLKGETVWDFPRDGRGVFRVKLEFDCDLVALAALKEAKSLLELASAEDVADEAGASIARLTAVRAGCSEA